MLVDRARSEGVQLTGGGGFLRQLAKRVLESALEGEITGRLGYGEHDAAGRNTGDSRNGTRSKTVLTDVGPVGVKVPRDVEGSFEPQIVRKRQPRLADVDGMVLSLSKYPAIIKLWEDAWAEFVPFFSFDVEIRTVICPTNATESVNARIRKAVRARGHFPNEAAALKCIYLALMSLDPTGKDRKRWTMRWKAPLNAFQIAFEGRPTPANN
ncbi:transposase [Streptomyces sp. NBC_01477]|nr:transposase [Streptomyces sp. NBC_01477]